jgi:hypothetical protein
MHVTSYHSRYTTYVHVGAWCAYVPDCEVADATIESKTSAAIPIVKQVFICEQILKHQLFYLHAFHSSIMHLSITLPTNLVLLGMSVLFASSLTHTATQLTSRHCRLIRNSHCTTLIYTSPTSLPPSNIHVTWSIVSSHFYIFSVF